MSSPPTEGPVVVNAGPLIALATVSQLGVLESLYERVLVPLAVEDEVVVAGHGRPGADDVAAAEFLERVRVAPAPEPLLARALGRGEAEVIALAHRLGARLTLLDERRARRIAEQAYGLRVKGTVGVLVSAKRAGLVDAVRPLLEALVDEGYFLAPDLVKRACLEAGE